MIRQSGIREGSPLFRICWRGLRAVPRIPEPREERIAQVSQYVSRLGGRIVAPARPPRLMFAGHRRPRRVAMLSVHTSPLHQPGTGDAGGMNVYIVELAERLAAINIEVEIFTRATTGDLPPRSSWRPACWYGMWTPAPTRAWPRRTCRPSCAPSPTA